jgi:hypothetical protein
VFSQIERALHGSGAKNRGGEGTGGFGGEHSSAAEGRNASRMESMNANATPQELAVLESVNGVPEAALERFAEKPPFSRRRVERRAAGARLPANLYRDEWDI